ncbi:hypothetical protein IWW55_000197 [Coemansia sp. RSA 2706]|nr:hypothetical protein IWW55_000197 [Coemansia sp. RSA 2706]KAJ2315386.1 hypothetical protein IWW54_000317 [Coemansia sp. RSA 2705]KAJ2321598.1 hypothetical protein IWW52_000648 [Coemansia sp. RSA 2704]KAJ2329874.1 hypothetical protein IWW51_000328 [Coemansia sp. RSA 2702]KAJ2393527.1 hypothetical protein H4S02_000145 [Coemansia sp. RSA 2611]KAJ2739868.1 hypothetical protein H4R23_000149 [Coemansia sp. Cherry 401B]
MTLEQIRKEIADSRSSSPQAPLGGRYIALLRRTPAGMLFSDPVFIAHDQQLPELPDGVQYIVVHPQTTKTQPPTMEAYMPAGALDEVKAKPLPKGQSILEDIGMYCSFLPNRDSSLLSLSNADLKVLSGGLIESPQDADVDGALELADRILSESTNGGSESSEISSDTLLDLGLLPADIGLDSTTGNSEEETAESLLQENSRLLAQLQQLQDARAQSDDYGRISSEEQRIATKLQLNLVRAAAAQTPAQLCPPRDEIQRAVKLLMSGGSSLATYAGTLPPQRRFAFMSNAVSGANVPQNATAAPMQRAPQSLTPRPKTK